MSTSQALFNECYTAAGAHVQAGLHLYLVLTGARRGARLELYHQESTQSFDLLWKLRFDRLEHKQTAFTDEDFKLVVMRSMNTRDAWFTRLVDFCEAHGVVAIRNRLNEICIQTKDRDATALRGHLTADYDEADHRAYTALARFLEYPRLSEDDFRAMKAGDLRRFTARHIYLVMDDGTRETVVEFMYATKRSASAAGVIRAEAVDAVVRGLRFPDGRRILRCETADISPT